MTSPFRYTLVPGYAGPTVSRVTLDVYNVQVAPVFHEQYYSREHTEETCEEVVLGTERTGLGLDCITGIN